MVDVILETFLPLALSESPDLGADAEEAIGVGSVIIVLGILLVILACCARGVIQTFRRNWIVALVLIVFLFPAWVIWAFVEIFLPRPKEAGPEVVVTHQGSPTVHVIQQQPSSPPQLPDDRS